VADVDATLMQQVLDVSERKWKANVHHDRQANDLRAAVKVLEGVRFAHAETLRDHPARLNRLPSDSASLQARQLGCRYDYTTHLTAKGRFGVSIHYRKSKSPLNVPKIKSRMILPLERFLVAKFLEYATK
jgi:hypothetical protein